MSPAVVVACLDPFVVVNKSLYCGGPTVALGDWLRPRGSPVGFAESWPQLQDRTVIGTHRGRTAVALACGLLGLGEGHEVLIPAYNCGTELDALLHAGVTPVAYRINRQCEIDLEDLIARKTRKTRAVYLIHYFGWEQPMADLRRWCDEQGLLLIEDCALALFSAGQTGSIGRTGDAAIYSLPKTLGTLYGGLLSLSGRPASGLPALDPENPASWLQEILHSTRVQALRNLDKQGLFDTLQKVRRHFRSQPAEAVAGGALPDMPGNYYFSPASDADRACHQRTAAVAAALDWEAIILQRRRNYVRLAAALESMDGCGLLFPSLPSGVCPLSLPLIVPHRDLCAKILQSKGIAAYPWWAGFHQGCLDWARFKEACELKNKILSLPVYQGLSSGRIDRLAKIAIQSISEASIANEVTTSTYLT